MTIQITWHKDMQEALAAAKKENKPVLIDFFNPG
jgi:uncharacterized protein YyaL (SSP411 family)